MIKDDAEDMFQQSQEYQIKFPTSQVIPKQYEEDSNLELFDGIIQSMPSVNTSKMGISQNQFTQNLSKKSCLSVLQKQSQKFINSVLVREQKEKKIKKKSCPENDSANLLGQTVIKAFKSQEQRQRVRSICYSYGVDESEMPDLISYYQQQIGIYISLKRLHLLLNAEKGNETFKKVFRRFFVIFIEEDCFSYYLTDSNIKYKLTHLLELPILKNLVWTSKKQNKMPKN